MFDRALIFALLSLTCGGRLSPKTWIQDPIVQSSVYNAGEILADTIDAITKLPTAFANITGLAYINLPVLGNQRNINDLIDKFITDFKAHQDNEDATLNIVQLAFKYGYTMETHTVETEDGYLVTMHRIPNNGPVILLMHGLFGSSDDFVIAGSESGIAYLLSKEGYDIWIGNARGNKHSRHHIRLDPSKPKFWNFSWHEIGYYDLPSMIDYALGVSNSSTLKYIGHSQGSTAFFVMASEREEYNKKVTLMVALSPVAFMGKIKSPLVRLLAPASSFIDSITSSIGLYEILPDSRLIRVFTRLICGSGPVVEILCNNILFLSVGFDLAQLNVTNLPVIFGHLPSGGSSKQMIHFLQNVVSKEFRKYNYGMKRNLKQYGSRTPPKYALHRVTAPVSLFYSDSDWLAHPDDVDLLYNKLPNAIDIYKIPLHTFNHLDFILAKDLKILIYKRLRKLLSFF
ncbi:unnamed protein product, partial [Brenthis ino]